MKFLRFILIFQLLFTPQTFSQDSEHPTSDSLPEYKMTVSKDGEKAELSFKAGKITSESQQEEFETNALKQPVLYFSPDYAEKVQKAGVEINPIKNETGNILAYYTETSIAKVKTIWAVFREDLINRNTVWTFRLNALLSSGYITFGYLFGNPNPDVLTWFCTWSMTMGFIYLNRKFFKEYIIFLNKKTPSLIANLKNKYAGKPVENFQFLPESSTFAKLLKLSLVATGFYVTSQFTYWFTNPNDRTAADLAFSAIKTDILYSIASAYDLITARDVSRLYQKSLKDFPGTPTAEQDSRLQNEALYKRAYHNVLMGFTQGAAMMLITKGYDVLLAIPLAVGYAVISEIFFRRKENQRVNTCPALFN